MNNDLYYVLVEKSTGESALKVKSVADGEGLQAYFSIYWWFVKTSGIAIQERSRKAMQPEPVSKEEKMIENIEAWEEDVKVVEMQGEGYKIPENVKLVALEILFSKFSNLYEAIERALNTDQKQNLVLKYNAILSNLKSYAAKKRLQAQHKRGKGDLLNVDELPKEEEYYPTETVWQGDGTQVEIAIDAIGKSKAMGKRV